MGHQMHEFGSLLSCDFACNPNIWSCKGFYRQYVARFSVSGAQTEHSANLISPSEVLKGNLSAIIQMGK